MRGAVSQSPLLDWPFAVHGLSLSLREMKAILVLLHISVSWLVINGVTNQTLTSHGPGMLFLQCRHCDVVHGLQVFKGGLMVGSQLFDLNTKQTAESSYSCHLKFIFHHRQPDDQTCSWCCVRSSSTSDWCSALRWSLSEACRNLRFSSKVASSDSCCTCNSLSSLSKHSSSSLFSF